MRREPFAARVNMDDDPYDNLVSLLADGKYTHWMAEFSSDQLAGLLWLVGEYAVRTSAMQELPATSGGERRRVGASNAIANFRREPLTLDDAKQYIRRCLGPVENAPATTATGFRGPDLTERDARPWGLHGIKGVRERFACACGAVIGEWGVAGELWAMSQQLIEKNPTAEEFNEALRKSHRPERRGGCI